MLSNIRIVLVNTFHPGNIGSSARAMKTMGLSQLFLVNPVDFPSSDALKMAAAANDLLDQVVIVESLFDAIRDCSMVIASSARSRGFDLPEVSPQQSAKMLCANATESPVALVFGPERAGLSNEDLKLSKYRVSIPANPVYSSLNLSSAVQILCYEIFKYSDSGAFKSMEYPADLNKDKQNHDLGLNTIEADLKLQQASEFPTIEQMEQFYDHLHSTLDKTGFIIKNHPGEIMKKLRKLFDQSQPDKEELNILRGILASVNRYNENGNTKK